MLFKINANKLEPIKESRFSKEKSLQTFVENNMGALFGLRFLETEFVIDDHNRVDSVAFDDDNNSFVLIEDKNLIDKGLVDQGLAYLAALMDRKEKFTLLYNEKSNVSRQIKDFDWSQTRIIFISPEFNQHQIDSTSFNDLPFDLFQLRRYGDIVDLEQIKNKKRNVVYKQIYGNSSQRKDVLDEVKVYTEEDNFPNPELFTVYSQLRDRILNLGDVNISIGKSGVNFKTNANKRFAGVDSLKTEIRLFINDPNGGIEDPYKLCKNIANRKWGRFVWEIKINANTDLDKIMPLVKQSYVDSIQ